MQPFVSVIIPTYRDWKRLELCLQSLNEQTYPMNQFEVIVINNDPNNHNEEIVEKYSNVCFLTETKPGSYAARNKGLSVARGSVIAFTDSDCIPDKDWIKNAVYHLEKNQDVKRIGGKIQLFFKSKDMNLAEIYESCYAFRQKEFVEKQKMAATANMITYKNVFDDVGNFNDSLMSGGDAEWGKRASCNGHIIKYCDDVVVNHPARDSLSAIFIKNRREAAGKIITNNKLKLVVGLIKGVMPPLKSIFYIRKEDNSVINLIIAFIIRYILRVDTAIEQVKVGVFKKHAERV